jgi:diketogulonate reductase-like aldo/keto reductase
LKNGYRLIDTAYMYGNEDEVGRAVRQAIADGICKREDVTVITKIYPGSQFANPEQAIQERIDKLNIGYVDIMLLHHPGDNDVKAYKAMEKQVETGRIHSLGISCFYIDELKRFLPQVSVKPVLVQNEIHPYYQDTEVVDYIHSQGIVVQAWYPLGGRGYQTELLSDPVLKRIAEAHGKSVVQVILRWHYQRRVVAIPGSSNPAHIAENIDIFDFILTDQEMADIAALNRDEKHDWY